MGYFKTIILLLAVSLCCTGYAQEMSVSTNVLGYVNLGTMNMEASWGFSRHWSANVGLRYNPFTFPGREGIADTMQARQRTVSVGGRYWPWRGRQDRRWPDGRIYLHDLSAFQPRGRSRGMGRI